MSADYSQQPGGQPYPGGPPGGAPLSQGVHEFSGEDNTTIERTATSASIWAVCAMIGAALILTLAIVQFWRDNLRGAILVVPLLLVCAVAGWIYLDAGRSMKQVVETEGNDVELLMRALDRMARAFRIEVIVIGVSVLVFAILVVLTRFLPA